MAIFMKASGIVGNATAKGYEKWIELESIAFGARRSIKTSLGNITNRRNGSPSFSEVMITKKIDLATNDLFEQIYSPEIIKEVEIHVCKSSMDLTPYAKYVFNDVLISEHQTYIGGDGVPVENATLNYVKLNRTYVHTNGNPYTNGFDLETVQKV